MVDVHTATQLLAMGNGRLPRPDSCHRTLLGEGIVHVDYADPDHVFLVTVTQVPRVHLPTGSPVVADLAGVQVRLVDVELANHVTVVLEGTGPVAEELRQEHSAAHEAWVAPAGPAGLAGEPPEWPAMRLLDVPYRLSDDVGTRYGFSTGEAGGDEHPWREVRGFLPSPPPDARRLRIAFAGGPIVDLPLPVD